MRIYSRVLLHVAVYVRHVNGRRWSGHRIMYIYIHRETFLQDDVFLS